MKSEGLDRMFKPNSLAYFYVVIFVGAFVDAVLLRYSKKIDRVGYLSKSSCLWKRLVYGLR